MACDNCSPWLSLCPSVKWARTASSARSWRWLESVGVLQGLPGWTTSWGVHTDGDLPVMSREPSPVGGRWVALQDVVLPPRDPTSDAPVPSLSLRRTGTNPSGEAVALGSQSPPNDSLTQFVQQPDVIYFILFLWLLVYCLLLFPQLDVSRL